MDILALQQWTFVDGVPSSNAEAYDLLHRYSGIAKADVDNHLLSIRKRAWAISRQPFIGRWKFLRLSEPSDPFYRQVLFRLTLPQSTDCLLDVGCGLGQALRQLRADGVAGSRLFGADIEPRFISLGYELFRDRHTLGATFIASDLLDPDDRALDRRLAGCFTIVRADCFFHLLSWAEQLFAARRLISWLRAGGKNHLIFGTQMGATRPLDLDSAGSGPYLHNRPTLQRLWDEAGRMTGTRWSVELEASQDEMDSTIPAPLGVVPVKFAIFQLPK